jgi:membrane protein YdbS with pleckstrin-like domain
MANGCKPIRILRVITISALLLCAPIGFAFMYVGYWLARSFVPGFIAAGLLMLTYAVSFIMVAVWPCPQCHKRFVRFNAFWPRRCSHCGQEC